MYLENANALLEYFDLETACCFNETPLKDRKVGFSIQREYPSDLPGYEPAKTRNGNVDTVALIHVIYEHPEEHTEREGASVVPMTLRIVHWSRYWNNHWDYNFDNEDCPTPESVEANKKSPKPVDLVSTNEVFFSHDLNGFVLDDDPISGEEVLNKLFETHIRNLYPAKGMPIRIRLGLRTRARGLMSRMIDLLMESLKLFGRQIEEDPKRFGFYSGYKREDLKKITSMDTLSIFGYKAPKNIIVLFGIIILAMGILGCFIEVIGGYLEYIGNNPLLALAHVIVILTVLDLLAPKAIFVMINRLIYFRNAMANLSLPLRRYGRRR